MNDEGHEIRRLPICKGETKASPMQVHCPRCEANVALDECNTCGSCVGLSLRDAYLVCGWDGRQQAKTETQGAPIAPAAQSMRSRESIRGLEHAPFTAPFGLAPLARFERAVVTANLDETALEAAQRMRDQKVGCLVAVRNGRPVGMLTDRDLVLRVVAERLDPADTLVSNVVTYEATTLSRSDGFDTAVRMMRKHGVRRLPIVDEEGRITGIVTADDLIGLLGTELAALSEAMEGDVDGSENR